MRKIFKMLHLLFLVFVIGKTFAFIHWLLPKYMFDSKLHAAEAALIFLLEADKTLDQIRAGENWGTNL